MFTAQQADVAYDPDRLRLALARLPSCLRRACKAFHDLTGLTAVVSLRNAAGKVDGETMIPPPIHPRCAARIAGEMELPCREHWKSHIEECERTPNSHSHRCPLELLCACIPIYLGNVLVGMTKMVVDSRTSDTTFSAATATLALIVSSSCHGTQVSVLTDELSELRRRTEGLRQLRPGGIGPHDRFDARRAAAEDASGNGNRKIVHKALDHLHRHYAEPALSLTAVAAALGCNGNYLTQRFTQVVGQRMRSYIAGLRVKRACERLLDSNSSIKVIAFESGFRETGQLTRAFRRHVGVTPSEYRRIFAER